MARILALLALAGTVVVLYVVVSGSLSIDDDGTTTTTAEPVRENKGEIPKKVAVEDGDSLSSIAEEYDISVKRIERLNPDIDPNTLTTGQVITLH